MTEPLLYEWFGNFLRNVKSHAYKKSHFSDLYKR